ncbi:hypothetical protein EG68_04323 [Paragonimus skrjabini miyazakii]|uniref:Uncharacterized protein n=1 Tax=Paragonimus skrjabini miyazakii TaxID=59628 RepID=A0A8S9YZJ4_9TREM|nr:hypothetical protein EG68_04323 [Paragonimus skrjabini miyazakii]
MERAEKLTTSSGVSVQTEDNSGSRDVDNQKCASGDDIKETSDDKTKQNQPESDDFAAYGFYTRGPAPNLQRPSRPYAPKSGDRMTNRAELRPPAWIPDFFHQSQ